MILILPLAVLWLQPPDAAALIEALGAPSNVVRSRAHELLRRMLPEASLVVQANTTHADPEIAERCRSLLADAELGLIDREDPIRGKVALVDEERDMVAVDVRQRAGAKAGDRFLVTRPGRKVGVLVLTDVHSWGSWARLESGKPVAVLEKGDVLEKLAR